MDWSLKLAVAALALWAVWGSLYAALAQARSPPLGRFVRVRRGWMHVIEGEGEGQGVLMLHGASANAREWAAVAARLPEGLRAVAMDRPGHGYSRIGGDAAKLETQAAAAAQVIEALELAPAIVVAHSLGCATAARLALERPDLVKALVFAAPATHPFPGNVGWHARAAAAPILGVAFVRLIVAVVGPFRLRAALEQTFAPAPVPRDYRKQAGVALAFRPKTFRANGRELAASKREFEAQYWRYDEIEAPAIVITSDEDGVVSPRLHALALSRALPRADLVVSPGAGHMPHQTRPEAVAAAIARLARLAPDEGEG